MSVFFSVLNGNYIYVELSKYVFTNWAWKILIVLYQNLFFYFKKNKAS